MKLMNTKVLLQVLAVVTLSCNTSVHGFTVTKSSSVLMQRKHDNMLFATNNNEEEKKSFFPKQNIISKLTSGLMLSSLLAFSPITNNMIEPANANDAVVVGSLKGSGMFLKDTLQVESFEDPKVKGVTLYLSNFQKPITERLGKDFLSDPSSTGVTCAKTGPVAIADNIVVGTQGEDVFQESKSLFFKSVKVTRIYDKPKNTVVYVVYSTRLNKNDDNNAARFTSSLCAVNLEETGKAALPSATATAKVPEAVTK